LIFFDDSGQQLQVTQNCHNALRHLRRKDTARTLWVDAICIDQNNDPERSTQIRMMSKIYSCAFRVVVSLGEATAGSRLLFKELERADKSFATTGIYGTASPGPEIIRELKELLQRPWFYRIWVIQEVWAANMVVFMCGSAYTSYGALYSCLYDYAANSLLVHESLPWVLLAARDVRELAGIPAELILWNIVFATRKYLASDLRDRIFALMAMVQSDGDGKLDALVNYSRNIEKSFTEVSSHFCL
jgi:hypothetical protein